MKVLSNAVIVSGYLWFGAIAVVLAWAFITGRLNTAGLLTVKGGRLGGQFSPTRLSSLIVTAAFVMDYLPRVVAAVHGNGMIPDVSQQWITALAGVQGVYLVGKATATIFKQEQ